MKDHLHLGCRQQISALFIVCSVRRSHSHLHKVFARGGRRDEGVRRSRSARPRRFGLGRIYESTPDTPFHSIKQVTAGFPIRPNPHTLSFSTLYMTGFSSRFEQCSLHDNDNDDNDNSSCLLSPMPLLLLLLLLIPSRT